MKKLLIVLFTMFYLIANAQTLNCKAGTIEYEGEIVSTIDVILAPRVNTIQHKFEQWMVSNYQVDLKDETFLTIEKEFMTAKGIVIPEISTKKIDLIVKVSESDDYNTILNVVASFGYDNWITENEFPFEYSALEDIVYGFLADFLPDHYDGRVEKSEEKLTTLSTNRDVLTEQLKVNMEEIKSIKEENNLLLQQIKQNRNRINVNKSILRKKEMKYDIVKERMEKM